MAIIMTVIGILLSIFSVYLTVLLPMGYFALSNEHGEVNIALQPGRFQRSVGEVVLDRRKRGHWLQSCGACIRKLCSARSSEYSSTLEATLREQMARVTHKAAGRRFLFDRILVDDQLTSVLEHVQQRIEAAFKELLQLDSQTLNVTGGIEVLVLGVLRDERLINEVARHVEIQLGFLIEEIIDLNRWYEQNFFKQVAASWLSPSNRGSVGGWLADFIGECVQRLVRTLLARVFAESTPSRRENSETSERIPSPPPSVTSGGSHGARARFGSPPKDENPAASSSSPPPPSPALEPDMAESLRGAATWVTEALGLDWGIADPGSIPADAEPPLVTRKPTYQRRAEVRLETLRYRDELMRSLVRRASRKMFNAEHLLPVQNARRQMVEFNLLWVGAMTMVSVAICLTFWSMDLSQSTFYVVYLLFIGLSVAIQNLVTRKYLSACTAALHDNLVFALSDTLFELLPGRKEADKLADAPPPPHGVAPLELEADGRSSAYRRKPLDSLKELELDRLVEELAFEVAIEVRELVREMVDLEEGSAYTGVSNARPTRLASPLQRPPCPSRVSPDQ